MKITQFKKNILSGFLANGINLIIVLLAYPIYLHFLSIEVYGLWATLSIILALGEVGNLGISEALMKYISQAYVEKNRINLLKIFNSSLFIITCTGAIIILLSLLLNSTLIRLLNLDVKFVKTAIYLIPIVGFLSALQLISTVMKGMLNGLGRLDLSNTLLTIGNLLKIIFAVVLMIIGLDIWSLAIAYMLNNLILIFLYKIIIEKRLDYPILKIRMIEHSKIKELLKYGGNIFGNRIVTFVFLPLVKGIIARYLGLTQVAYFEIAWKMVYNIRNMIERGLVALLPKVSELFSQKNYVEIKKKVKHTTLYSLLLGMILLGLLFIFSDTLVKVWLTSNYSFEIVKGVRILAIGWMLSIIFIPAYYAVLGLGNSISIFIMAIIRTIINIAIVAFAIILDFLNLDIIFYSLSISLFVSHIYIGIYYLKLISNRIKTNPI